MKRFSSMAALPSNLYERPPGEVIFERISTTAERAGL
jgi:hypothetical protein